MRRYSPHHIRRYDATKGLVFVLLLLAVGALLSRSAIAGGQPSEAAPSVTHPLATASQAPPSATPQTAIDTQAPPSATPQPATDTQTPSSATSQPATATQAPPSATPQPATPQPPTATQAPPTVTPRLGTTPTPTSTLKPACRNTTPIPADVRQYAVETDDSLACISQRTGIPLEQLVRANPQILDPDLIRPGDVVNLPR